MWLVPESLRSALALEASSSGSDSSTPMPDWWLSLSGKAVQRPTGWRGWRTRAWSRRLFGAARSPDSPRASFVAAWTSSLRGCPASPTAPPGNGSVTTTSEPSGPTSSTSWEPVDPPWSFSRTCQLSLLEDTSEGPAKRFADWATQSKDHSSSVRRMLAHRIGGRGCSSWPTPYGLGNGHGLDGNEFSTTVRQWPTPDAQLMNDGADPKKHAERLARMKDLHGNGNGAGTPLAMKVKEWTTPPNLKNYADRGGQTKGEQLPNFVAHSPQAQEIAQLGSESSQSDQTSRRPSDNWPTPDTQNDRDGSKRRSHRDTGTKHGESLHHAVARQWATATGKKRLNPLFVEWLMGWPIGWTNHHPLDAQTVYEWRETASSLFRLLWPSSNSSDG